MKTSSCKAKGRKLQQIMRDALLSLGQRFGLEPDDVRSTAMGQNGVDLQLSPAARRLLGPLAVEAKNRESLNVPTTFWQHAEKYPEPGHVPVLVHKRNRTEPLVTITLKYFLELLNWRINVTNR